MVVLLIIAALLIFGVGYLLGALAARDFVGKGYTILAGVVGGIGALCVVTGIVFAACSRMRF